MVVVRIVATAAAAVRVLARGCLRRSLDDDGGGCGGFDAVTAADGEKRVAMCGNFEIRWFWCVRYPNGREKRNREIVVLDSVSR